MAKEVISLCKNAQQMYVPLCKNAQLPITQMQYVWSLKAANKALYIQNYQESKGKYCPASDALKSRLGIYSGYEDLGQGYVESNPSD